MDKYTTNESANSKEDPGLLAPSLPLYSISKLPGIKLAGKRVIPARYARHPLACVRLRCPAMLSLLNHVDCGGELAGGYTGNGGREGF